MTPPGIIERLCKGEVQVICKEAIFLEELRELAEVSTLLEILDALAVWHHVVHNVSTLLEILGSQTLMCCAGST